MDQFTIFKNKNYRHFWGCNLGVNLAIWTQNMACAILVSHLSISAFTNSLVQVAATLPFFLFGLLVGFVGDHYNKCLTLAIVQGLMALISLILFFIAYYSQLLPWHLILLTFLFGVGTTFRMPIGQVGAVSLVANDQIKIAAIMNNLGFNLSRTLGPTLAGIILLMRPSSELFLFAAIILGTTALIFYSKRAMASSHLPTKITYRECFKRLFASLEYRHCCFDAVIIFFSGSVIWSLMPYFARYELHEDAGGQGLLMGMIGVGALLTAILLPMLVKRFSRHGVIACCYSILFISLLTICCFHNQYTVIIMAALVVFGLGWSMSVASLNGLVQSTFDAALRARALSIYLMIMYFAQAMGSLFAGSISHYYSMTLALSFSIILLVGGAVIKLIRHKF